MRVRGEQAPSNTTCKEWFQRFESVDFDTEEKEHGKKPQNFYDAVLEAFLKGDSCQTQLQSAAIFGVDQSCISCRHLMGFIHKNGF